MSIKVKQLTKDYDAGARIVDVRISSSKSFKTPNRSLTSTEHNYRNKAVLTSGLGLGKSISFENEIMQISKQHDIPQLRKFLKKNGTLKNARKDVLSKVNSYSDKLTLYYPRFNKTIPVADGTGKIKNERMTIGIENLRTLVDFQILCELENISILESNPNQKFDVFLNDFKSLSKRAFSYGTKNIVPFLDLEMDNELFKLKYEYFIDSGTPIIGLINRSFISNYPNYRYLQNREDDVLLYCAGVDRYWRSNWTTAYMHLPQYFGIDVVGLESKSPNQPIPEKPIEKIKRFDSETLGIIQLDEQQSRYDENLNCNCPVCSGKTLNQFIEEYSNGYTDSTLLDKYCKLHETYSSREEFNDERKFIQESDSLSYINEKEYLVPAYSKVINK